MSFRNIRDQEAPLRLLRNMLRRSRIPNGLLFWGPGGIGKRITALEMAKAINCAQQGDDACDACLSCRKITNANHPDVALIVPVKRSRIIDVDTVHAMTDLAGLRPFESKWRVFIIEDADRMGAPAQNHFLKTLEEPPGNSLFILISEFPGMLLSTIRSRCQRVRFGALRPETVTDLLLRDRDLPRELAESIAVAQGQMSRALDLVESDKRDIVLDITRRLAEGEDPVALAEDFGKRLDAQRGQIETMLKADTDVRASNDFSREDKEEQKTQQMALIEAMVRRDIMEYLYLFQTWYRDVLVYGTTQDAARVLNRDQLERLKAAKPANDKTDFDRKFAAIRKARVYLERFLNEERVFRDLFFVLAE